jgi:hypothetical protein
MNTELQKVGQNYHSYHIPTDTKSVQTQGGVKCFAVQAILILSTQPSHIDHITQAREKRKTSSNKNILNSFASNKYIPQL